MSNVKKFLIGLLCAAFLICMLMAFKGFMPVYAETNRYFSAEECTNSDKLLNYDGTSSENETIFTFVKDVHNSEMAAFIPDLSRVVPLQYLENDGTYSYFGKEYGFYMVVEEPYIDLLLVDISYELEEGKLYGEHPYAGPIVGENTGTVFNCSNENFYISTGNLHSWWAWFITYDQLKNINNIV